MSIEEDKHKVGKNLIYSRSNINIERLNNGVTAMVRIELLFNSSGVFKNLSDDEILSAVRNRIEVSQSNDDIFKFIEIKPPSF